jgi:hypothetical protein
MLRSILPLLVLAACSGKDGDSGTGDSTVPESCSIAIDSTVPTDGAADAYYRGNVEFILSEADDSATIETSIPGTQITSEDGLRVIWQLSAPLDPNTSYSATLHYCGGDAEISFTTSSLGTPIDDPSSLEGRAYVVDLPAARIVEPPGIGAVLTSYLTTDILIGVNGVTGSQIDMIGAVAVTDSSPPVQDYCTPSIPFPPADFSESPFFAIGPQDTTLNVAGYEIDIQDLLINGTFAADGTYFDGGVLSGTIDTRPLAPPLDDSGNEGAICDLAVNFGATCEACPSDGQPYCLSLVADQIYAEQVDGVTLVPVLGTDCAGCDQPDFDPGTCEP